MKNKKEILVFAAHPDDEILGCGGTLKKYFLKGYKVSVVFFTNGVSARNEYNIKKNILKRKIEAKKAAKVIGINKCYFNDFKDNQLDSYPLIKIIKIVEKKIKAIKPEVIFTHYENDLNVDHQMISKAVITACRPIKNNKVKKLLFFEVPSSTEWQIKKKNIVFSPNFFEDISTVKRYKLDALRCYKSELREWPHPRSIKGVQSLFNWRGSTIGVDAAEAFMVGRIMK